KPQFEVGRERLGPGGVVRADHLRHAAVAAVATAAEELGWTGQATVPARVAGESGNQEYFLLLRRGSS
ncbi:MAG TPA: SAM-dependent methyltransferase, partial [Propionibacteriaceae bacterium]|nr:SAM-dependent methyltransferase [Propionibacteriaceae bacterium]